MKRARARASRVLSPLLASASASACVVGCGGSLGLGGGAGGGGEPLRHSVEVAQLPSGVRGPRLVPESVDLERSFGVEPGGGLRGIAAGVRVVSYASGAVMTAPDRLTQAPSSITVLPERLGGGALFAIGDTLFRSEKWLSRAEPVLKAPGAIRSVWVGLDRVVLRMPNGALVAVNPVSGAPLDLGALPPSPAITAYAALDGFRAVALADLRGVVATTDAGATWRTVPIPAEPRELVAVGDTLTVLGISGRDGPMFEVRPEGDFVRITPTPGEKTARPDPLPGRTPHAAVGSSSSQASASSDSKQAGLTFSSSSAAGDAAKIFGQRPLALAVADGIPLADGSSLIAHAGSLGRVRLADGAILDIARDAFPLRSAKCHGVVVGEPNGAGFVCGEPRGRTHVYRYVPSRRGLELVMAFDLPRVVLAGGNGALAVRGRCAEDAPSPSAVPGVTASEVTYCVRSAAGVTREQVLTAGVENARVVPLRDGRLAVVVPPRGDIVGGHLTIVGNDAPITMPLLFDEPAEASRKVLGRGMWLDGFEERSPGVLGGWVEHAGTVLGVEIKSNGHARHGAFVRDIGNSVIVAGRFGLGWTGAQRGFETTDGGLTWRGIDLPDKIDGARTPSLRGCGAAGCVLSGWIRVGWGELATPPANAPHSLAVVRPTAVNALELSCEVISRERNVTVAAPVSTPPARRFPHVPSPTAQFSSGTWRTSGGEFTPFFGVAAPARRTEDVEAQFEVQELADHQRNVGPLARVYVWGAKGLEWDATSRWIVRWSSPFTSSGEVFSTPAAAPPKSVIEAARFAAGGPVRALSTVTLATSEDARHALLVGSRQGQASGYETVLVTLEEKRAPVEVRRADGESFAAVHAAMRIEGRWFVATDPGPNEPAAAVIWEIEAGAARELARIPRIDGTRSSGPPFRLAHRQGESTLGLVVEGQPNADGRPTRKWVIGVDTTSGRLGELELLGGLDYDGRTVTPCTGDEGGWALDLPLATQAIRLSVPGRPAVMLRSGYGRVRLARGKACVERLTAQYDGNAEDLPRGALGASPRAERSITVGLMTNGVRQELRCRAP